MLVCSFVRSCVRSFVRSFAPCVDVCLFVVCAFVHVFATGFVHYLVCLRVLSVGWLILSLLVHVFVCSVVGACV